MRQGIKSCRALLTGAAARGCIRDIVRHVANARALAAAQDHYLHRRLLEGEDGTMRPSHNTLAAIVQGTYPRPWHGKTHDLEVAGFVNDLSQQPTPLSLTVYGFTSLETLAALGEPTTYNAMYIRLSEASTECRAVSSTRTHNSQLRLSR